MQCLQVWCSPSVRCGCKWCSIDILPVFYRRLVKWVCRCTFYAKLNPFTLCNNATHPPNKSLLKNIVTANRLFQWNKIGNFLWKCKIILLFHNTENTWGCFAIRTDLIWCLKYIYIYIYIVLVVDGFIFMIL